MSSNTSRTSCVMLAKSTFIYDLYSCFANSSAIVDFPTRLAPSRSTEYFGAFFSFQYFSFSKAFLLNILSPQNNIVPFLRTYKWIIVPFLQYSKGVVPFLQDLFLLLVPFLPNRYQKAPCITQSALIIHRVAHLQKV
ncbi:MAG: hypothetical protein BWY61_00611 [Firmicutes bacterium ADurb.Bin354]|nr:MAG: hypothetical protein BWY61_00611 [Firmicutes bacterium ADurb.Bin354]